MTPQVELLLGDAEQVLRGIPAESIHACITSPSYFGLRDYGVDGQIGVEQTPEAYVDRLVAVFREVRRVLRSDGTCWIVIGDCYNRSAAGNKLGWEGQRASNLAGVRQGSNYLDTRDEYAKGSRTRGLIPGYKQKDLIGVPWMLAFALRADGWYLREVLPWMKHSCMPESVRDRCTVQHEFIIHLAKSPSYYFDWFAIAEPAYDSDGALRNPRSVWQINPEPIRDAHFAAFPSRLASRVIEASTSEYGVCTACGAPAVRVVGKGEPDEAWKRSCGADTAGGYGGSAQKDYGGARAQDASATKARILAGMAQRVTIAWVWSCRCEDAGLRPATILDPFVGSGTSAICASRLGRHSIGIDLKHEYLEMAARRLLHRQTKCLDGKGNRLPWKEPKLILPACPT